MSGAFDRMSSREKVLVSSLLGLLLVLGVGGVYLFVSSDVADLRVEVEDARDSLSKLRALAPKYQQRTAKTRRFRALTKANDGLQLQLEANRAAKAIRFERLNSAGVKQDETINLASKLSYPGKTEKFLGPKTKKRSKKSKKGKDKVGYFRKDEPIRVTTYIPFDKLYEFLTAIEMTEKMLFVTRIDMRRLRNDGEIAQSGAAFTLSTYVYRGGEDPSDQPQGDGARGSSSSSTGGR